MFGPGIQRQARGYAERIVRPLAALGLTPNMATLLGLVLNAATAVVLALGHLRIGGAMLLFAGVFDMVDGALARVRNQKTVFGAFFDSTLDRFSEGIVLLGIIVYALTVQPALPHRVWIVCLAYVAGLGSLMVSYTRARAEGLGIEAKSGLMARPERVVLLAIGLIPGVWILGGDAALLWTLGILAVTSVFTSVQRIAAVWVMLGRSRPAPAAADGVGRTADAGRADAAADGRPRGDGAGRSSFPLARGRRRRGYADRPLSPGGSARP